MRSVTEDPSKLPPKGGASRACRTCVGCGQKAEADELLRLVFGPRMSGPGDGQGGTPVAVDLAGGAFGRGAHLHASLACLEKACKSGLARAARGKVIADAPSLSRDIQEAADRRLTGLILGARRARQLAPGADATAEALRAGAGCVIIALDAKSVVERPEIAAAIQEGRAVAFQTKSALGSLLGREEVAVVAVTHRALAEEIKRVRRMSAAFVGSRSQAVWWASEVR